MQGYKDTLETYQHNPYNNPYEIPEKLTHSKNLLLYDVTQREKAQKKLLLKLN